MEQPLSPQLFPNGCSIDTVRIPGDLTGGTLTSPGGCEHNGTVLPGSAPHGNHRLDGVAQIADSQFRGVLEHLMEGCQIIGFDWRYLYVNAAAARQGRTEVGALLGRTLHEAYPGVEHTPMFAALRRCMENRERQQIETEFTFPDGSAGRFQLLVDPVPEGISILSLDFTDRRRTEDALRESEEHFRATFEMASVGMAQSDPVTGHFLRVNQKFCELTGYSEHELMQRRFRDITVEEDREIDWETFQRVVRGELPSYHLEKRYRRKDGQIIWVNVNMTVLRDGAGKPSRTMATVEDITARRQANQERLLLATAMEQATEVILITDPKGTIVYTNPAFERTTGYSRKEAIGGNPRLMKSGKHDGAFYRQMWETLTSGKVWRSRITNRHKNGTFLEKDASISPVRDSSGKITHYVAVMRNITREVELEAQVRQSQKMEAIGQLAGGVAHDFNNILCAIMIQADLAASTEGLPLQTLEDLQQIQEAADRAANLTRQLLVFSRKQVIQPQDVDLNEIVANVTKMLHRIIGEDVSLDVELCAARLMTHADPGMLDQILLNLAVNARDAMPNGGQALVRTGQAHVADPGVYGAPDARPGKYVWLSLTDTGSGIDPELLPRIFEPFFTTKEVGKGTGLGLATVFGIVKQHQGWIHVRSEVGCGTTFQIFLPEKEVSVNNRGPQRAQRPPRDGSEKVLLVEDDAPMRLSTLLLLERHGYKVVEAASGPEAIELFHQHPDVELLLTDLVMPGGITGHELARTLHAERPSLKIVFVTGYSPEIAGQEIRLRAGEKFLQKPFSPDLLLKTMRRLLDSTHPAN